MRWTAPLLGVLLLSPSVARCADATSPSGSQHENDLNKGGVPQGQHGNWDARFGPNNPAAMSNLGRYGGPGAPIGSDHDIHYIQNHMASMFGGSPANDNHLTIPPPAGGPHFNADPGGGTMLASPPRTVAPWEMAVLRPLVQIDLAINPKDPYALRVAGIQDSYNADYAKALPQLRTAIEGGQKDATALSFGALAAFHQGDMKSAGQWAKESLSQDSSGPWAKLADSVHHLVEDKVGRRDIPPPVEPPRPPRPDGLTPVGERMAVPRGLATSGETFKGVPGIVQDARDAFAVKDYPAVEKLSSTALFQEPKNAEALRLRAAALLREGRYKDALVDAQEGLAIKPKSEAFLAQEAMALARGGRYDEARAEALSLLAIDPKSVAGLRLLAYAEAGLGHRDAMEAALEKAAALDASAAELLRRARALPEGADALALFTDAVLLGDSTTAPAGGALPTRSPAATVFAVGGGVSAGLVIALGALALRRRRKAPPSKPGLDLSEFQRRAARRA